MYAVFVVLGHERDVGSQHRRDAVPHERRRRVERESPSVGPRDDDAERRRVIVAEVVGAFDGEERRNRDRQPRVLAERVPAAGELDGLELHRPVRRHLMFDVGAKR
jgi:hypothetical protein